MDINSDDFVIIDDTGENATSNTSKISPVSEQVKEPSTRDEEQKPCLILDDIESPEESPEKLPEESPEDSPDESSRNWRFRGERNSKPKTVPNTNIYAIENRRKCNPENYSRSYPDYPIRKRRHKPNRSRSETLGSKAKEFKESYDRKKSEKRYESKADHKYRQKDDVTKLSAGENCSKWTSKWNRENIVQHGSEGRGNETVSLENADVNLGATCNVKIMKEPDNFNSNKKELGMKDDDCIIINTQVSGIISPGLFIAIKRDFDF